MPKVIVFQGVSGNFVKVEGQDETGKRVTNWMFVIQDPTAGEVYQFPFDDELRAEFSKQLNSGIVVADNVRDLDRARQNKSQFER